MANKERSLVKEKRLRTSGFIPISEIIPDVLKSISRKQLQDLYKDEQEFQKRRGLQQLGEILKGIDDPDDRNWIKQLAGLEKPKNKKGAILEQVPSD